MLIFFKSSSNLIADGDRLESGNWLEIDFKYRILLWKSTSNLTYCLNYKIVIYLLIFYICMINMSLIIIRNILYYLKDYFTIWILLYFVLFRIVICIIKILIDIRIRFLIVFLLIPDFYWLLLDYFLLITDFSNVDRYIFQVFSTSFTCFCTSFYHINLLLSNKFTNTSSILEPIKVCDPKVCPTGIHYKSDILWLPSLVYCQILLWERHVYY